MFAYNPDDVITRLVNAGTDRERHSILAACSLALLREVVDLTGGVDYPEAHGRTVLTRAILANL